MNATTGLPSAPIASVGCSALCDTNVVVPWPSILKLSALLAPPPSRPEPRNTHAEPDQRRTKIWFVQAWRPAVCVVKSASVKVVLW